MPEISVIRGEGATLVTLEEDKSLLSLPEKEQIKIIKLMEKGAIKKSTAVELKKQD